MNQINLYDTFESSFATIDYDYNLNPTDRKCLSIFMEYLNSNNFEEALRLIQNEEYSCFCPEKPKTANVADLDNEESQDSSPKLLNESLAQRHSTTSPQKKECADLIEIMKKNYTLCLSKAASNLESSKAKKNEICMITSLASPFKGSHLEYTHQHGSDETFVDSFIDLIAQGEIHEAAKILKSIETCIETLKSKLTSSKNRKPAAVLRNDHIRHEISEDENLLEILNNIFFEEFTCTPDSDDEFFTDEFTCTPDSNDESYS